MSVTHVGPVLPNGREVVSNMSVTVTVNGRDEPGRLVYVRLTDAGDVSAVSVYRESQAHRAGYEGSIFPPAAVH